MKIESIMSEAGKSSAAQILSRPESSEIQNKRLIPQKLDTVEISDESKRFANNDLLNVHSGLTLDRVLFLLTPRV